jgi:hypothetical protein
MLRCVSLASTFFFSFFFSSSSLRGEEEGEGTNIQYYDTSIAYIHVYQCLPLFSFTFFHLAFSRFGYHGIGARGEVMCPGMNVSLEV